MTAGADPGFQVRRGALKKLCRAEGGAKMFGVFRVKNHDFTPKKHIFSNFRGARARCAPSGSAPGQYYKIDLSVLIEATQQIMLSTR